MTPLPYNLPVRRGHSLNAACGVAIPTLAPTSNYERDGVTYIVIYHPGLPAFRPRSDLVDPVRYKLSENSRQCRCHTAHGSRDGTVSHELVNKFSDHMISHRVYYSIVSSIRAIRIVRVRNSYFGESGLALGLAFAGLRGPARTRPSKSNTRNMQGTS